MVKRVDVGVLKLAEIAATGNVPTGHIELGLKDGAIGLTSFKYTRNVLTPAQFRELDALKAAVIGGKIVPPTTREALATFKPVAL
jgi:basic membrane lipoprotein Med (substrate-binding protein (PBP1-ABC) superfamily)